MKDPRDIDKKDDRRDERTDREEDGRRAAPPLREFARKLFSTGAEAVHMTEEGLRTLVGDVNPREAVSGLFESVSKGTDSLQSLFVREARRYLDAINLRDELGRVLANYTIEINAKVNFVPREKTERKRGRGADKAEKDAKLEAEALRIKLVPKEGVEEPEKPAAEPEAREAKEPKEPKKK